MQWLTKRAVPIELIKGIVEDVFGKAKEVIGTIIGRNDLINEGKAQQDKAEAQRNAGAKKAVKAEKARGEGQGFTSRVSAPSNSNQRACARPGHSPAAGSSHSRLAAQGI